MLLPIEEAAICFLKLWLLFLFSVKKVGSHCALRKKNCAMRKESRVDAQEKRAMRPGRRSAKIRIVGISSIKEYKEGH